MEIKWIEDFVALARLQSFSRAAEERNVSQSGFSRRIQSLEQWIGAELIDRSSFPPVLTPAGQLFREVADDVLAKLFDTRAIIRTEQRIAGKSLQIAAGHTIALNFLPAWLKALEARGRAMNQRYSLGTYSGSRSRVDVKTYVAIGAGIAALLAALAIVVTFTRRTSRPKPRVPKSA